MCDICGRIFCASGCPNDTGNSPELGRVYGICGYCGATVQQGEKSIRKGKVLLCAECAAADLEGSETFKRFSDAWFK